MATYDIYASADPSLKPGEARCPGPSVQDVIAADGDAPPATLRQQAWEYLGDTDMPLSRYTSRSFHDLEMDRMWRRVWQWACREEHVQNPGDFYVYDIGDESVLVIRDSERRIRAYVNSCPHRGMQFFDAGAQGKGRQFLRCPFHGMSWNLDGSLREIPCRWDFPHVKDEAFGLDELPCDTWGGFVFINFDRNAGPLNDYLEVLPEHFRTTPLENRYVALHMEKVLPGNWKMCMEGFLESYHVLATHPRGLRSSSWANTQYDCFSPHVSRFFQNLSGGNQVYEKEFTEAEKFQMLGHDPADLPAGVTARHQHAEVLRKKLGAEMGVDLSGVSTSIMLDSIEYHLFPNACFFPGIVINLIYRFRPLGVDKCVHDILCLVPVPDNGVRPPPAPREHLDEDQPYVSLPSFNTNRLAAVLDEDTDNFKRQWAGMKASHRKKQTLATYQEVRIRHFHNTLDTYLAKS